MPQLIVTTAFKFAHHGYQVEVFEELKTPIETTDEVVAWAIENGCGHSPVQASAPASTAASGGPEGQAAEPEIARARKANAAAPENK